MNFESTGNIVRLIMQLISFPDSTPLSHAAEFLWKLGGVDPGKGILDTAAHQHIVVNTQDIICCRVSLGED